MALKVFYHGAIRFGESIVSSSESTQWLAGRVLKVATNPVTGVGLVSVATGVNTEMVGLALSDRVATTAGPTTSLVKVGAPTGERAGLLISQAIVQTDQLTSGSSFNAGDFVYIGNDARLCSSGIGHPSGMVIGKALSDGAAGDTARPLTLFLDVQF